MCIYIILTKTCIYIYIYIYKNKHIYIYIYIHTPGSPGPGRFGDLPSTGGDPVEAGDLLTFGFINFIIRFRINFYIIIFLIY